MCSSVYIDTEDQVMKLYPLTSDQAAFIWQRGGTVWRMAFCVTRELPIQYNGEDLINQRDGLTTRKIINEFSRREDYPTN